MTHRPRSPRTLDPSRPGPEQLEHITALVVEVRPEWDAGLVRAILHAHAAHVSTADLAVAAIRYATIPDAPGPKGIGWRGPHWRDLATAPPAVAPRARCGVCGRPEDRCWGERPGPDDHQFEPRSTS